MLDFSMKVDKTKIDDLNESCIDKLKVVVWFLWIVVMWFLVIQCVM